jgi:hypothetical protein
MENRLSKPALNFAPFGAHLSSTLDHIGRMAFVALAVVALSVISHGAIAAPPWYQNKTPAASEIECKAIGGEWSRTPFFQTPFCRIKFADGGKECRRAYECQSHICVIETPKLRLGKCHGEAERFATFWYLDENGKPEKISVE